ncbi:MAG TPA: transferrin receptor-like dimerization domain-containing protein [Thermoanaerobaculia bacterium]|nr:transferrin receptor-like dimerization domain-containing protein [Thermoanaerobaculia bacterium]
MHRRFLLLLPALLLIFAAPNDDKPIFGFTAANAAKEHALEAQFDSHLNRDDLRTWMKRLSARPHHLGSAYDHDNQLFVESLFKSWGYDTHIEQFDVLFPTPKTRVLELVAPEKYTAKLAEGSLAQDATSGQTAEQLPVYNAYSVDGDVTGDLVYVNYGIPADYEQLERRGVDVKGKIVIARYGNSWRGIKPKVAAEHGAIGCIIYSDPRDDGYFQGDVYPKGAYRNDAGAQRGSVMDMPVHPGDPLTPGVGATKSAKRLDIKDVDVLTKIPVLPISYSDALPLLRALEGPVAPPDWRGALPITYHLGAGPARVHLKLAFDWKTVPAYDVVARLEGSERGEQWVMHGNHSDAWVNGASDPISGLVAELEEARAIGELAKTGWKPKRTIIYFAWDGEEEGLLGSTEWAEEHAEELRQHGVVYLNTDSNSRGFFDAGGSHTLERLVTQAARDVVDPERNVSVLERMRAHELAVTTSPEERKAYREHELIRLDALGSGSDYTTFLQHVGVAALNDGFSGEGGGGSYHSIYDSFDHYTRFGDPTFDYGVALAKTNGRIVLRLANADVLPFEFTTFADTLSRYLDELTKLADTTRRDIDERNRFIRENVYVVAADPTKTYVPPEPEPPAPYLNFAPLQNAVAHLQRAAKDYAAAAPGVPANAAELDRVLMHVEQLLTRDAGLPRRPWFRHQIYAPGFYTGYGVKTLPGVREAIEQKNWTEASQQIEIVSKVIDGYAAEVERAAGLAKR